MSDEFIFCDCCSKKLNRHNVSQLIFTPQNEASEISTFCRECFLMIQLGIETLRSYHIEQREQKSFNDRIRNEYK